MATIISPIPYALLQCDLTSPGEVMKLSSLPFEFGWACDCFNQQTTVEVILSDFPDWGMKDRVASTLFTKMLILGALTHHQLP